MASPSREILLVCSPDGPITAYDASTGAILANFSGSQLSRKGLTLAGNNMIVASYVSSDATSGSIHLYNWWSSNAFQHLPLPEPVAPLVSTPDGLYLFCGGLSGCIHTLGLPSGDLLRSFTAHCNSVSCMTINDDASLLISGGDDGTICVFPVLRLLDSSSGDDHNQFALYRFDGHGSSVTAITIGMGGCSSTIISCSLDFTCKLWSLANGSLIRTVCFPCMIWGVAIDPTESEFYAGGSDGRVYKAAMKVNTRQLLTSDAELVLWTPEHNGAVMAVAVLNEGHNVASAADDGSVWIWEVQSGDVIRAIKHERISISDLVVAKGIRDCNGFGFRTNGIRFGGQSSGYSCREISRPIKEISEMENMLNVVVKDRKRAIDTLETSIQTYQRLLGLILNEARADGGTETDSNNKKSAG